MPQLNLINVFGERCICRKKNMLGNYRSETLNKNVVSLLNKPNNYSNIVRSSYWMLYSDNRLGLREDDGIFYHQ